MISSHKNTPATAYADTAVRGSRDVRDILDEISELEAQMRLMRRRLGGPARDDHLLTYKRLMYCSRRIDRLRSLLLHRGRIP